MTPQRLRCAPRHGHIDSTKDLLIMQDSGFETLRGIGLTPAMAQQLARLQADAGGRPVRVVEVHRETLRLHDGTQELVARVWPKLRRELLDDDDGVAVGDWGLALTDDAGQHWLTHCLQPLTALTRRDADGLRHIVVSNVDTALIVMGLDADFNLRRLERFLALVEGSGVLPVVVLSKPDLCADPQRLLAQLQGRLPPRVSREVLDSRDPAAAAALAPWLQPGSTLVLLGSSGAGKSTLANTLMGAAVQPTGATRDGDGRGRHTTTARSLHRLPGGACLIDTPGVRTLRPDADEATLAASFDDIARLSLRCRFRDCRHEGEPGCAVREGVDGDRIDNFHKLQREMRRDTLDALERRQLLAQWKARGREGRMRMRAKRGEE
jgi:ribosome biogenesis GTPase